MCIVDDVFFKFYVREILKKYVVMDKWIKIVFCFENGYIFVCLNLVLELVIGEFIVLLDYDDILILDVFYEVVLMLNIYLEVDMIYLDEDKLN